MTYYDFIHNKHNFGIRMWLGLIFGVFVFSGIFGFVYETIFYFFNNGALTRRGTCYGPWIDIYGYGGLVILLLSWHLREKPWAVFLASGLGCGLLELITGYSLFKLFGNRSWDYNTEILNFGNIGGFVCLRSVLVFAVSGMVLIYVLMPCLIWLCEKIGEKPFLIIMAILAALFFVDFLYNDVISHYLSLPNAIEFYGKSGWYPLVEGYTGN